MTRADVMSPDLRKLEAVIENGMRTFVEVGLALQKIRDRRMYRDRGYATFADYCTEHWGWTKSRSTQLISAAKTVTRVTTAGLDAPTTEFQVRALNPVKDDPEKMQAAWASAVEAGNGKPTAADVHRAVRNLETVDEDDAEVEIVDAPHPALAQLASDVILAAQAGLTLRDCLETVKEAYPA